MRWSANLAYAIGLIATDGSLSKDGRHIDFTSKDLEQIVNFKKIFKLKNKIGLKSSGTVSEKKHYRIQFGDVLLYRFLLSIGLTPNKSKTIGKLHIPQKYFPDFLRGSFDGDGSSTSYWSKEWKNSFILYSCFTSASKKHLLWLRKEIFFLFHIKGYINHTGRSAFGLLFAKKSSVLLFKRLYYQPNCIHLKRKKFKIDQALGIIRSQQ